MQNYDVIVVGGGPAGTAAAYSFSEQGKTVAIVEADLWGGTCPNRGCDPKKILRSAVEAKAKAAHLAGKGITGELGIDWKTLMAFKRSYTDTVPTQTKQGLVDTGITTYEGEAGFIDEQTLRIGSEIVSADQFLIATGQRPALLPIKGQEYLHTSTDFLAMEKMPAKITFLGAGYVAFELATIAQAAGAEVHIIHHNDRPLKAFDQELVNAFVEQLQKQGISFHFNVEIESISQINEGYTLQGTGFELDTDYVVSAVGRIPNVESLHLENAGVDYSKRGIKVNDYLQTSNPRVFACGDVLDKEQPKLTPVSSFEAKYAVASMSQKGSRSAITYPLIPTIVFGGLKLARIGQSEKQLAQNLQIHSETINLADWFTYRRINDPVAMVKLVYNQEGQIIVITCLSSIADELIDLCCLILEKQLTHQEIEALIFAYPTPASDLTYII